MTVKTKNFNPAVDKKLKCTCGCGGEGVQQFALNMLQKIRDEYGKAMIINSGYRCKNHPDEVNKAHLGSHTQGVAFDIAVSNGVDRRRLVELGLKYGACVGVAKTFVHLDWREGTRYLWSY